MKVDEEVQKCDPRVLVFLACRDRLDYFMDAIDSIIGQDYSNVDLVISDNSIGGDVGAIVSANYPNVKYRKRGNLSAVDHFNAMLQEVDSEFFVLFHDDDVMRPSFISTLVHNIQGHPECSAVACNAYITWDKNSTRVKFARLLNEKKILYSAGSVFENYFNFKNKSFPPFPSYLYRKSKTSGLNYNEMEGGKYNDVAFLMRLASKSPLLWLPDRLMYYRFHTGNGRNKDDFKGRLRLLRFALAYTELSRRGDDSITAYRVVFLSRYFFERTRKYGLSVFFEKRSAVIIRFILGGLVRQFKVFLMQAVIKLARLSRVN